MSSVNDCSRGVEDSVGQQDATLLPRWRHCRRAWAAGKPAYTDIIAFGWRPLHCCLMGYNASKLRREAVCVGLCAAMRWAERREFMTRRCTAGGTAACSLPLSNCATTDYMRESCGKKFAKQKKRSGLYCERLNSWCWACTARAGFSQHAARQALPTGIRNGWVGPTAVQLLC